MNFSRLIYYAKDIFKRIAIFFTILYMYGLITYVLYDSIHYLFGGWIFYLNIEYIERVFTVPLSLIFIFLLFIFQYLNVLYFLALSSIRRLTIYPLIFYFTIGSFLLFFVTKGIVFLWKDELKFYKIYTFSFDFSKYETQAFWFGIVLPYLIFYSWFLPLWYYKLGDWFWQRGKWAKNSMQ